MNQNYSNFKTVRSTSAGPKAKKSALPWVLGCFGSLMAIGLLAVMGYFVFFTGSNASQSFITIREPLGNEDLQIGEMVTLRAVAKGDKRIEQVEIWVDDILISYENSDVPGGISPFPILTSWVPRQAGLHTISARSTDSSGKQSVNQITVNVLENIDSDGDSIPDHLDRCPNQPGTDAGQGCMDRDYDGIPDDVDACPDEAGLPKDGCPAPSENDRDGDGFLDDADECPDEVGSPSARGCPDTDGDGFANSEDPCPDEAGTTEGCPTTGDMASDTIHDRDGDGVLDHEDACPDIAGSVENGGCPEMSGGVLPPPPDPEADDEDSFIGDMGFEIDPPHFPENEGFMGMGFALNPGISIEIRAKEFYSAPSYDSLWCYVTVSDNPPQRYDFDTNDNHYWNIEEVLGGDNSLHIMHTDDEPLNIQLTCMGEDSNGEMMGGLSTRLSHPPELWNGQTLLFETSDNSFQLQYQVCTPSCDDYRLVAPILQPPTGGPTGDGPYILRWRWEGRSADLDGFKVQHYRNGELYGVYDYGPTIRNIGIADYLADCSATDEFEVYGYKGSESTPISNREAWIADLCGYTYNAIVNYYSVDIHHPMADEGGAYEMGPILGWMTTDTSSQSHMLIFNAMHLGTFRNDGLWLGAGEHRFSEIFNWIHTEQDSCLGSGCHANDYWAPETSIVQVRIEEGDDLIIAAEFCEYDTGYNNDHDCFYGDTTTISFDQLVLDSPTRFVLEGEVSNLVIYAWLQNTP